MNETLQDPYQSIIAIDQFEKTTAIERIAVREICCPSVGIMAEQFEGPLKSPVYHRSMVLRSLT